MPPRLSKGSTLGPYPYRILRYLGDGGTSTTYLAELDDDHDRRVVIKLTPANDSFAEQALMNEMQHLRRLDHPGIVRRYRIIGHTLSASAMVDTARAGLPGKPWFSVLEYLHGGSLEALIAQHKQLPIGLALAIGAKIAEALAYMHDRDIVHLDIKPANVLFRGPLTEGVDPVLIDFGIARGTGQTGLEGGTRAYCAPERLLAELDVSRAASPHPAMDVYSLGVILYEMLVGKRPFEDRKERTTNAMMRGDPTRPSSANPNLSRDLDDLLVQSLSRDPEERPTAAQLVARLHALSNNVRYREYEIPPFNPDGKQLRRRALPVLPLMGGAAAAAVVIAASFLLLRPGAGSAPAATATVTAAPAVAPATATGVEAATATARPSRTTVPTAQPAQVTSTPQPTFTPAETGSTPTPTLSP